MMAFGLEGFERLLRMLPVVLMLVLRLRLSLPLDPGHPSTPAATHWRVEGDGGPCVVVGRGWDGEHMLLLLLPESVRLL